MPKSAKKKKEKVADFSVAMLISFRQILFLVTCFFCIQKAKLKLGKGKAVANNAIDTSFKARCECPYFSTTPRCSETIGF
jgi:pre-rRNA-processing protein IPI1